MDQLLESSIDSEIRNLQTNFERSQLLLVLHIGIKLLLYILRYFGISNKFNDLFLNFNIANRLKSGERKIQRHPTSYDYWFVTKFPIGYLQFRIYSMDRTQQLIVSVGIWAY